VGILNIAPIAGAYAWSYPLESCLKAHGASVQFIDINGNLANIPTTLQEFTSEKDRAVFDVGAPLGGQTSFLGQAASNHVPVIGFDTGVAKGTVTQDTNDSADGAVAASYVVKELGSSKGTVLVLTYTVQPSTLARGLAAVAGLEADKNLTVKTVDVPELSVQAGQESATAALQADPGIKAIIGDYSDYSVAAASAVTAARSKAIVVGINGDPDELADIRSGGPLKATVSDNVAAIGQLSCETGAVMLRGGAPKPGTTVEAGTTLITSANLPPVGKIDNSPTTFSPASS
jgi:ABC-type sugar transport system substrate-binding protein